MPASRRYRQNTALYLLQLLLCLLELGMQVSVLLAALLQLL